MKWRKANEKGETRLSKKGERERRKRKWDGSTEATEGRRAEGDEGERELH